MTDGFSAATSLSPEIYLADIQVERFSRSLLVHHPITINCIDSIYIHQNLLMKDRNYNLPSKQNLFSAFIETFLPNMFTMYVCKIN
uniref:Uncharacterized protein n=1 Tax=Canis lupus familiaris TaxID=9615 RepID=A0A8C0P1T1_CANLF